MFLARLVELTKLAAPEVLETMFFAAALPDGEERCVPEALKVRIAFRGCPSGVFTMRLDPGDARALGAAFLGRDPDELGVEEDGLLACELANILCGSVLSRAEADGAFELDAPELLHTLDEPELRSAFVLDTGGALEIGFRIAAGGES